MVDRDDRLAQVFAALADPTRRDLVARLADGDATVSEPATPHDVPLHVVSRHLKVLQNTGRCGPRGQQQSSDPLDVMSVRASRPTRNGMLASGREVRVTEGYALDGLLAKDTGP